MPYTVIVVCLRLNMRIRHPLRDKWKRNLRTSDILENSNKNYFFFSLFLKNCSLRTKNKVLGPRDSQTTIDKQINNMMIGKL